MTELPSSDLLIPFSRSPMKDMFFEVGAYVEALARLQLMVSNSGLGVLTGEVGSGKSTLVRRLGQTLDPIRYQVILSKPRGNETSRFLLGIIT